MGPAGAPTVWTLLDAKETGRYRPGSIASSAPDGVPFGVDGNHGDAAIATASWAIFDGKQTCGDCAFSIAIAADFHHRHANTTSWTGEILRCKRFAGMT